MEHRVYFKTNCKFTIFWILGALLTPLLFLKTICNIYSHYHNAGYRTIDIVFALLSSLLLPLYVLVFVCVLAKNIYSGKTVNIT